MTSSQFLLLYLLAGCAVAAAVYLTFAAPSPGEQAFQVVSALAFWPFYLTLLLARGTSPSTAPAPLGDSLARAIAQVDAELEAALDGVTSVPDRRERRDAIRAAWSARAERVREMDRLLAQLAWAESPVEGPASERMEASRAAVQQNLTQLRQVRERSHQQLMESLAGVRELVSMMHVARFSDAPAASPAELFEKIVVTVRE